MEIMVGGLEIDDTDATDVDDISWLRLAKRERRNSYDARQVHCMMIFSCGG